MATKLTRFLIQILVGAMLSSSIPTTRADEPLVFVSSFAAGDKGAIQAFHLEPTTGVLKLVHRTTEVENPFFMVLSKDQKFLYSIHAKTFGGKEPEQVAAFALEGRTGRMTLLNRQSSHGTASCYLDIDSTGKTVLVANYSTGNVASLPVRENGSLAEAASVFQHASSGVDTARQKGPNAHCIVVSPDNRFAIAADLGIDQLLSYRLDPATAKLSPNEPPFAKAPAGAGPRHLTFHPNGKHVYVINELKSSITLFDYVADSGKLTERQTISTLPADFEGKSFCADLKVSANGRFLYGTNRGHNSIAAYRLAEDGRLSLIGIEPSLGNGPQNLVIAANGTMLLCANMAGNNIAVFRMDTETGLLKPVGEPLSVLSPSCIRLLP